MYRLNFASSRPFFSIPQRSASQSHGGRSPTSRPKKLVSFFRIWVMSSKIFKFKAYLFEKDSLSNVIFEMKKIHMCFSMFFFPSASSCFFSTFCVHNFPFCCFLGFVEPMEMRLKKLQTLRTFSPGETFVKSKNLNFQWPDACGRAPCGAEKWILEPGRPQL